jgi:hypothetical protein
MYQEDCMMTHARHQEFEFQVHGTSGLMTFAEIDEALKDKLQDEICRLERRIVEVIDVRPVNKGLPGQSLGEMTVADVLLKFR